MEKVDFKFKRNGTTRIMPKRQAELLQSLGHGEYMTRVMTAGRPPLPAQADVTPPPVVPAIADELDALDREQLHALAKERGIYVHPLSGAEKVRAALRNPQ
jgi:hypothetical protein